MIGARSSRRRAAALLITLAAIVLVTSSLAALAAAATGARTTRSATARAAMAEDLLLASDAIVADWLRRDSGRMSVPLDEAEPRIAVLRDEWTMAGHGVTLAITAWDQQGMVPITLGQGGSSLRLTLPPEARRAIDALAGPRAGGGGAQPLGLDQVEAVTDTPVYPAPVATSSQPALGALIATHAGSRAGATININTAPLPLLQAALREAGAGGLDAILAARAEGTPARIGAVGARGPRSAPDRASTVSLADASSAWAIRTDIALGPLHRAWWSVWERRSGAWRLVQRMEIAR